MNLTILISIIIVQLIFQAVFFEKYYVNKKEEKLQQSIGEFKEFLLIDRTDREIMEFINWIKRRENIALSYRESNLYDGYSLKSYMGENQIIVKVNNEIYNVILGDQFPKVKIKKGDNIEVYGYIDNYGYMFAQELRINGVNIEPYYNINPTPTLESQQAMTLTPATMIPINNEKALKGRVDEIVPEDNSYYMLGDSDIYLDVEEKKNIFLNNKYITKTYNGNGLGEILVLSEKLEDSYIIAITQLAEVNDVIGSMNSYYFIIFVFAFILVIIISLFYSRYMTKPLVEMSGVAKKISQCDFKYKYNVKSEDEIGMLGNSLNLISSNLEKSLCELQDMNKMLKEEMDIKEVQEEKRKELIANISHELKTPITIIQGSISGIKSGMYSYDMFEDILEETNKMNELVKEMLEISKLESPTFVLKKEPFDLGSIFLKEKDKLKALINEKNLMVSCNEFDEIIVFGDEKRINQVVTNLLTNALKYTPDYGTVIVNIVLNHNEQYIFSIENFGVVLNDEEIERIWDPFYRKEKSRNKRFGGTGLGLSIVKRILEIHNSDFGVQCTENSVRFYFTIGKCNSY